MNGRRKKVSNLVLIAAVAAVVCYAVTATVVQLITAAELSPTLTTAWFSFWGAEIIALAAIKTSKVRHGVGDRDVEDIESFGESCDANGNEDDSQQE